MSIFLSVKVVVKKREMERNADTRGDGAVTLQHRTALQGAYLWHANSYISLNPAQLRKCRDMNRLSTLRQSPPTAEGGRCAAPGAAKTGLGLDAIVDTPLVADDDKRRCNFQPR